MAQLVKTIAGLAIASVKTVNGLAIASVKTVAGLDNTSGGGPAAFSDDFAGTGALSASWTNAAGAADRNANAYRLQTGSFGNVISIYSGTSAGSLTQYVMATQEADPLYPWYIFRYTDSSSPFYAVQIHGDTGFIYWYKFDNAADTSGTEIANVDSGAAIAGITIAVTITGTGNATHIRIWRAVTGLPSAADNWNGDTSPDAEFTTDPGVNAVDSGTYVGIGGQQSIANDLTMDNFFGGGL